MDNITASEIAGFGVGTLILCATIAAPKVDAFISASQRSSLGMCRIKFGRAVLILGTQFVLFIYMNNPRYDAEHPILSTDVQRFLINAIK